MERRKGGRWGRGAFIAAMLALQAALAQTGNDVSNVRLVLNSERFAVARALGGAARTLGRPECQALLDEFVDLSGRPLRATLRASGLSATEYLDRVFFYDAPSRLCEESVLAVTTPGSRAVFVCGPQFVRQTARSSRYAEAILIHEAFHSLGLGENPPSSDHITDRIQALCG